MPLFGAHMSIAGGYYRALVAAIEHECQSVQLFTKNNNQWRAKPISDEEIRQFKQTRRGSGIRVAVAHDSYLINLASPDDALFRRSLEAFIEEVHRADRLGLEYLVTHPGSHTGAGEEAGIARVIEAIDETHTRCNGCRVEILLETTAGQGTSIGYRFEHLAEILGGIRHPERVGVCIDTCHIFAAGYPLSPVAAYKATFREFSRHLPLSKIKCFHVNDSKRELGSRIDRHEHIGKGRIGLEGFRLLVNDYRFRGKAMILETPKESGEEKDMDRVNLAMLRKLVESRSKRS